MDPQDEWQSIIDGFPVSHPPFYEMLVISLHSRSRLCLVPVAVMNTGGAPILRFALPGGSVPPARVKPRTGPIFFRRQVSVRVTETMEGDCVLDSNGDEELIDVDLVDASPAVLESISRAEDGDGQVRGFKAYGPDDVDGTPLIPVWPSLQDLLEHSVTLPDRPTVAYEPEDLVPPPRGSSWDMVGGTSEVYATGASGSERPAAAAAPSQAPLALPTRSVPSVPLIPGLDPAEVAQAMQNGVSLEDLETFARIAFTIPQAARPPLLGTRSPPSLTRQWPPHPKLPAVPPPPSRPPTQTHQAAPPPVGGIPPDFFVQLADALQQGLRPSAAVSTPLERALAGLGGGSIDTDGTGSIRRQGRARILLCQALEDDPAQFSAQVDRGLCDAFPSRPANARPTMREYVEHRSKFTSSHRPSMLTAWSVAGARDALRNGHPEQALARLDVLMVALEQISIDSGSLLMAQELLWEPEPPTIAYNAASADSAWRKPVSALCAPEWAEVAFSRLRDLDDWALRKSRLTAMGPGRGKGKGKGTDMSAPGGGAGHDAPAAPAGKKKSKAKAKGKAPGAP